MERNKSDKATYAYATSSSKPSSFPLPPKGQEIPDNSQEPVFMKYASSIIQVVSEQKLEKGHQNQNNVEYSEPVLEISDVIRYGGDSKTPEMEAFIQGTQMVPHFKKKNVKKSPFIYNFTNLTTLVSVLAKFYARTTKKTFDLLKSKQVRLFQPVKNKASFHSGTTSGTYTDDFRSKRQIEVLKKLQNQEQRKEGANAIKGWIQFKILMIQNSTLRTIQECQGNRQVEELSPIAASKKDRLIQNFYLSQYQHQNDLTLTPTLQHMEESLAYTADHNFQFSRKEYTITTPDKMSEGERALQSSRKFRANSGNPLSQAKESLVQQYKQYLKKESRSGSKVLSELQKRKTAVCSPLELKINEERRYLTVRTDYHVLPFISQQDLRKVQFNKGSDMPLKTDVIPSSEPEFTCDNAEAILKDFQELNPLFRSSRASKPLTGSSSRQSNDPSCLTSMRDKYSKVKTEQSRASQQITQTCKIQSRTNIKSNGYEQEHQIKINHQYTGFQQRKAPLKIENYYFPGRQTRDSQNTQKSKDNNEVIVEYPRNRLDEVKQVDSILSKHQREIPQKSTCRIEESMVSKFAVAEEPKIKAVKGTAFPVKIDRHPVQAVPQYSKLHQQKGKESRIKHKPKISINMPSSNRKIEHSPHNNIHLQGLSSFGNSKKNELINSPRHSNPYSPSPQPKQTQQPQPQYARPIQVQQEYGSCSSKRIEQPLRPESRGSPAPAARFNHNNIYQINRPLQHQQRYQIGNPYHHNQRNTPQMVQNTEIKRPPSRIYSPQPCQPQHQFQQPYAMPTQRQPSLEKKAYFSPQIKQDHYFMQSPVRLSHNQEQKTQPMMANVTKNTEEYFITDSNRHQQERAVNFNNRYYTSGVSERPGLPVMTERQPFVTERQMRPYPQERRKSRMADNERPHSSSRQSLDRPNIFSIHSPQDSQIELTNGSNPWSSRTGSKLDRPKSMNAKIHLTLRSR